MKEFILKEDEEILANFQNVPIRVNENKLELNVILTSVRIVLLKNTSNESLDINMASVPSNLEVALIIPFTEIKELKYIDDINMITFKDNNNEIDIKCDDFKSYRIQLD